MYLAKSTGVATISTILRNNAESSYDGLTVGPNDADQVLLQWKLPDGTTQRIYGDLRDEIMPSN
jgi:hypothetical protein